MLRTTCCNLSQIIVTVEQRLCRRQTPRSRQYPAGLMGFREVHYSVLESSLCSACSCLFGLLGFITLFQRFLTSRTVAMSQAAPNDHVRAALLVWFSQNLNHAPNQQKVVKEEMHYLFSLSVHRVWNEKFDHHHPRADQRPC